MDHRQPTKPSVAVLTSTYARYPQDPQVPWMRETNNRLSELGHSIEVIAPAFKGLASHEIDGVSVNRFRYLPKSIENITHDSGAPSKMKNPLMKLRVLPYLIAGFCYTTAYLLKKRPDCIKVHWPFPHGLMAWLGARLTGAKIISVCHGAELALVRGKPLLQKVLSWSLRQSDLVYCNSSHTLSQIRSLPGCADIPVEIVTYGSTLKDIPDNDTSSQPQKPIILSCGRVIERKGYPYLIKAMPEILKSVPDAQLYITSDGDYREKCEQLIKELGLEDSVTMTGYISNEELTQLYQDCAVYVHPSIIDSQGDTEGLGVVLIEALSNRKPVVASAVGGIVDVIKQGESGILVNEKSPQALAKAVTHLLSNPEVARELGEQGYQYGKQHFSWARIIERLSGLICETHTETSKAHHKKPIDSAAPTTEQKQSPQPVEDR